MLPSVVLSVVIVTLGTLAASYGMVRASHRSALWNVWVGAMVVLATAIALVIVSAVAVRYIFPEFY